MRLVEIGLIFRITMMFSRISVTTTPNTTEDFVTPIIQFVDNCGADHLAPTNTGQILRMHTWYDVAGICRQ